MTETNFSEFTENLTIELPSSNRLVEFAEAATGSHRLIVEVAAIHEGLTGNFNFYSARELEHALESWTTPYPKPIILNHDINSDPMGRVMSAAMDIESDGSHFVRLQIAVTSPEAISRLMDQRYLTGSVGGKSEEALCSICGKDWAEATMYNLPCRHERGKTYKGKLAYLERKQLSFHEYSFVNAPADKRSSVRSISVEDGVANESDEWLTTARIFDLNLNKPEIFEFTESENRDVLGALRKKEAAPLYHQLKGAFLSVLAIEEDEKESQVSNEITENEDDVLAVVEQLSDDLANEGDTADAEEAEVTVDEEVAEEETAPEATDTSEESDESEDNAVADAEEADETEETAEADEDLEDQVADEPAAEEATDEEAVSDEEITAAGDEDQSVTDESELLDDEVEEDDETEADEAEAGYAPPAGVRSAAARGLELRKKFNRGGTMVGVARARDLSNGKSVSLSTIKRMVSYFARHEVDKKGQGWKEGSPGYPSAGLVAWLLWGGDEGRAWANKIARQAENATAKASDDIITDDEIILEEAATEESELTAIEESLELRVLDLEEREQELLEENARLKKALHRTLAERVVDTKIAFGIVNKEDRDEVLEDHVTRTASSLADSLRDLANMTPRTPAMPSEADQPQIAAHDQGNVRTVDGVEAKEEKKTNPEQIFVDALMGRRKL